MTHTPVQAPASGFAAPPRSLALRTVLCATTAHVPQHTMPPPHIHVVCSNTEDGAVALTRHRRASIDSPWCAKEREF
eukprot:3946733-Amphidinium_carterae.1